jgi:hypothetical protein
MLRAGYPNQRVEIFNINAHQEPFSNLLANIHTHPTEGIKQNDLKNLTSDFPLIFDGVRWPDVIPFKDKSTTARCIVDASREFFVHGPGAPVRVWSDNGPQFDAMEFKNFAKDWNFSTGTSSPHCPQSNGSTEATVKSMKKVIARSCSINHYCYSGTHLVQALSHWHRWCSTALFETRYPFIVAYRSRMATKD